MTAVERDGPCVITRTTHYVFTCHDCGTTSPCRSRRDAEDLFDRHTHQEAE